MVYGFRPAKKPRQFSRWAVCGGVWFFGGQYKIALAFPEDFWIVADFKSLLRYLSEAL